MIESPLQFLFWSHPVSVFKEKLLNMVFLRLPNSQCINRDLYCLSYPTISSQLSCLCSRVSVKKIGVCIINGSLKHLRNKLTKIEIKHILKWLVKYVSLASRVDCSYISFSDSISPGLWSTADKKQGWIVRKWVLEALRPHSRPY